MDKELKEVIIETLKIVQTTIASYNSHGPIKYRECEYRIDPDDPLNMRPKIPIDIIEPWKCIECKDEGDISQWLHIINEDGSTETEIKLNEMIKYVAISLACNRCSWCLPVSEYLMKRKSTLRVDL